MERKGEVIVRIAIPTNECRRFKRKKRRARNGKKKTGTETACANPAMMTMDGLCKQSTQRRGLRVLRMLWVVGGVDVARVRKAAQRERRYRRLLTHDQADRGFNVGIDDRRNMEITV